jgi:hypothetical protein
MLNVKPPLVPILKDETDTIYFKIDNMRDSIEDKSSEIDIENDKNNPFHDFEFKSKKIEEKIIQKEDSKEKEKKEDTKEKKE